MPYEPPDNFDRQRELGSRSHRSKGRGNKYLKQLPVRLATLAFLLGFAYLLGTMGRKILITGVYDYTLESSDGTSRSYTQDPARVKHEEFHTTGSWAREQGFGFVATAATFCFWAILIFWGMAGPVSTRIVWNPLYTLATAISFTLCLTVVLAFYPPWRIGWESMSTNAFYLVMGAFLYLATLRDCDKLKEQSQKVFPALIASGVVIGTFWTSYLVGIVAGIFIGLILAFHVVMLIPSVRAQLLKADPSTDPA